MNIDKLGQEFCVIKDDPTNVDKKIYLYEGNQKEHKNTFFFNELTIEDGYFQIVPDKKIDRTAIFIAGMNGSGKSYWIMLYLKEFIKKFPTYKIYMFSSKKKDDNLDSISKLKRIEINESFINEPIKYEDLSGSMCIFDDIDALPKQLKDPVYHLQNTILQNGRSYEIHCLCTSHSLTGRENQIALNESNMIVFFLRNYNKSMRYFLENYIGLEQSQIKKLRKNASRSTVLIKTLPNIIAQEKNLYTLESL